jgi:hypothetical protein
MVAVRVGVFEALADGPAAPEEVARRCGTAPCRPAAVMALVGVGYLEPAARRPRRARSPRAALARARVALGGRQGGVRLRRVAPGGGVRGLRPRRGVSVGATGSRGGPRGAGASPANARPDATGGVDADVDAEAWAAVPARSARGRRRCRGRGRAPHAGPTRRPPPARPRRRPRALRGRPPAPPPCLRATVLDLAPAVAAALGRRGAGRPAGRPTRPPRRGRPARPARRRRRRRRLRVAAQPPLRRGRQPRLACGSRPRCDRAGCT